MLVTLSFSGDGGPPTPGVERGGGVGGGGGGGGGGYDNVTSSFSWWALPLA